MRSVLILKAGQRLDRIIDTAQLVKMREYALNQVRVGASYTKAGIMTQQRFGIRITREVVAGWVRNYTPQLLKPVIHKHNDDIRKYAIELSYQPISCKEIAKRSSEKFGIFVSHAAIQQWIKKARPGIVPNKRYRWHGGKPRHSFGKRHCAKCGTDKTYITKEGLQMWTRFHGEIYCRNCGTSLKREEVALSKGRIIKHRKKIPESIRREAVEMASEGYSYSQIIKWLDKQGYRVAFQHTIGGWIEKFNPELWSIRRRRYRVYAQSVKDHCLDLLKQGYNYRYIMRSVRQNFKQYDDMYVSTTTIKKWANNYGITTKPIGFNSEIPAYIIKKAVDLHLQGHAVSKIVRQLKSEYGKEFDSVTVRGWIIRNLGAIKRNETWGKHYEKDIIDDALKLVDDGWNYSQVATIIAIKYGKQVPPQVFERWHKRHSKDPRTPLGYRRKVPMPLYKLALELIAQDATNRTIVEKIADEFGQTVSTDTIQQWRREIALLA